MPKIVEIDILKMELDGEQPADWLAPHVRDSQKIKAIRDKHRAKYLAKRKAERSAQDERRGDVEESA